jgi:tRNA threonylcarbamoyladenosine biosynthesis protein TsaB
MDEALVRDPTLLLIDTCGETAGVALFKGKTALVSSDFERGHASSQIVAAVRDLLDQSGLRLADLDGISVVSGPGSFTGVRTGLAVTKGLCEAVSLPLLTVSRLEVLAEAADMHNGYAVLDAGRGQLYIRDVVTGHEWLSDADDFRSMSEDKEVAVAESLVAERLVGIRIVHRPLNTGDSIYAALRCFASGGADAALAEANYVRAESEIYRKPGGAILKTSESPR